MNSKDATPGLDLVFLASKNNCETCLVKVVSRCVHLLCLTTQVKPLPVVTTKNYSVSHTVSVTVLRCVQKCIQSCFANRNVCLILCCVKSVLSTGGQRNSCFPSVAQKTSEESHGLQVCNTLLNRISLTSLRNRSTSVF